ncbi:MAG: nucleotidyltransferase domain-containing protein [Spirochaetaceae bacterium]|nr:nucleotidyltransferase domain-containing protein [Spirochaetaceae bacterium]
MTLDFFRVTAENDVMAIRVKNDTSIQAALDKIVQETTAIVPDGKVFLFGSYATGMQKPDSDIDICVVADGFSERPIEIIHAIRDAIADKINLSVDILVFRSDDFYKNSILRPTIEHTIINEGILLNA